MIHQINNYIFLLNRSKPKNPIPSSHQLKLKHQTHLKRRERKKIPIMSSYGVTFPLILLFLLFSNVISYSDASTSVAQANGSLTSNDMSSFMEPEKVVEMRLMMNESRRKLSGFQICALCTCCGGAKGLCLPSPCCYAINCNIPNRPFGFCSFTPKTCNCFGCHI